MRPPAALAGMVRAAVRASSSKAAAGGGGGAGGGARLKSVSELDPSLLAKARRLAVGVGTAAGAFGSLVGVGGGVLIGPVILNACPAVPQRVISGTSLAAVATTGATAGAVYWASGCVDARSAAVIALSAVATAPLGARMTHRVDCQRLRRALGYWLYLVAPLVPLKAAMFARSSSDDQQQQQPGEGKEGQGAPPPQQQQMQQQQQEEEEEGLWQQLSRPPTARDCALAATGALAGFASGMLGIGGGTVVTPLLALATGGAQQVVLGTSLAAMVLPSLVGLAQHQRLGNVDWRMAAALAAGTTAGSWAGSHLAVSAPPGLLEALFAAGMLLLGRRTLAAAGRPLSRAVR